MLRIFYGLFFVFHSKHIELHDWCDTFNIFLEKKNDEKRNRQKFENDEILIAFSKFKCNFKFTN